MPRVEDFVGRRDVGLFRLMVVALLERGGPLEIEEVADRLERAGADAPTGDLVFSLRKAWHGMAPVVKNPDGRFALDFHGPELDRLAFQLGLRPPRGGAPEPVRLPTAPGTDVPLTEEELRAAADRWSGVSAYRLAAALLDARTRPMSLEDISGGLSGLDKRGRHRIEARSVRLWRGTLLVSEADGRLALNLGSGELPELRRKLRELARPTLEQRAKDDFWKERRAQFEARRLEEERQAAAETATLRRAIVHAVPAADEPRALSILDMEARSIETFLDCDADRPAILARLHGFDVLVGLHVRDLLQALDVDPDRWRLTDLKPPRKTRTLNRRGRKLEITPELLISATTGVSRPLGDPSKIASHLENGEETKLRRRLESDAKALFAFYRYGLLHRCVRLRWGFLEDTLGVDWSLPGDPSLRELLTQATKAGSDLEIVLGSAPGWEEPWSRACRARVLSLGWWDASLLMQGTQERIDLREVQAIRVVRGSRES